MDLAQTQRLLARLYTNAAARENFFAPSAPTGAPVSDPARICNSNLRPGSETGAPCRRLAAAAPAKRSTPCHPLDRAAPTPDADNPSGSQLTEQRLQSVGTAREILAFARALQRKRANEAAHCLPLTHAALGERFTKYFCNFAQNFSPHGDNKPVADAIAFADHLASAPLTRDSFPAWLRDLARFEAACVAASTSRRLLLIRCFRSNAAELISHARPFARSHANEKSKPQRLDETPLGAPVSDPAQMSDQTIRAGSETGAPLRATARPRFSPSLCLWWRFGRDGRLRFISLSLPRFARSKTNDAFSTPPHAPSAIEASA
jgi:hypothetical protein